MTYVYYFQLKIDMKVNVVQSFYYSVAIYHTGLLSWLPLSVSGWLVD